MRQKRFQYFRVTSGDFFNNISSVVLHHASEVEKSLLGVSNNFLSIRGAYFKSSIYLLTVFVCDYILGARHGAIAWSFVSGRLFSLSVSISPKSFSPQSFSPGFAVKQLTVARKPTPASTKRRYKNGALFSVFIICQRIGENWYLLIYDMLKFGMYLGYNWFIQHI